MNEAVDLFLQQVPDRRMNEWFDVHAQYVYKWRCLAQGVPKPTRISKDQLAPKLTPQLSQAVYQRDFYRCRYCNLPLVSRAAFQRFAKQVGEGVFPIHGAGNKRKAGAYLVFSATADHVEPWSLGGATGLENLVTVCWPCNFGKMEYTVGQLQISDPRLRRPIDDGWNGLSVPLRPGA